MDGIDRVDNNFSHVLGNLVVCCKQCNYAKNDYTQKEFFEMVKNIYEKHFEV